MTDETVTTGHSFAGSRWTYMDVVNSPVLESLEIRAIDKTIGEADRQAAHLLLDLLISRHNRETA